MSRGFWSHGSFWGRAEEAVLVFSSPQSSESARAVWEVGEQLELGAGVGGWGHRKRRRTSSWRPATTLRLRERGRAENQSEKVERSGDAGRTNKSVRQGTKIQTLYRNSLFLVWGGGYNPMLSCSASVFSHHLMMKTSGKIFPPPHKNTSQPGQGHDVQIQRKGTEGENGEAPSRPSPICRQLQDLPQTAERKSPTIAQKCRIEAEGWWWWWWWRFLWFYLSMYYWVEGM